MNRDEDGDARPAPEPAPAWALVDQTAPVAAAVANPAAPGISDQAPATPHGGFDQHFLARTVAIVALTLAVAGLGFITGHYVVAPTPGVPTPRVALPNSPSNGFGNASGLPGYPGFSGFGPSTPTSPTSPADAAAAKIAKAVDPGLVDVISTLSYQSSAAEGTGMILNSNGLVLTNNHVIAGATSISARDVATGTTYSATVVGYDVSADVAVLQLSNASGLATVTTGNSKDVVTGEKIVGIGNAGGTDGTPSFAAGKVVALQKAISASDSADPSGAEKLSGLIQMSADIQPGDSGGPLVNTKGRVIGMDTAGSPANGGFGYQQNAGPVTQGFAIPINTALKVVKSIENNHATSKVHVGATAFLGVEIRASSASEQSSANGVMVSEAIPSEPAADAGIVAGDVITSLNAAPVTTGSALQTVLLHLRSGESVTLGYVNASGVAKTATVTLGTGPAQ